MEKNSPVNAIDINKYKERGYLSEDILPQVERKSNTFNYFTLWMGSIHNIPNYAAVVGYLALGLSAINVILAITFSGLALAIFLASNGHAGTKYGIPFAMHLRSTYGDLGSKLPGFLRGGVAAIAWFGVQNYTGAVALTILISRFYPGYLQIGGGQQILGLATPTLISFIIFWLLNMAIGLGGGAILNKFTAVLTPIIYIVFGGMMVWAIKVGGGIGPILSYHFPATSVISAPFAYLMIIASVLSVWAAPGVSVADFTKDAVDQKSQTMGQVLGLSLGYFVFAIMAVVIIIGGTLHYGPIQSGDGVLEFINRWDSLPAIILTTGVFLLTTISTNATGNIIPAGYQLAALLPKYLNYKKGVWLAGIISIVIMPWRFMADGSALLTFLNLIGALLGPVAGVMVAHYYLINKQQIKLDELYFDPKDASKSRYKGTNIHAYIATLVGLAISVVGQFIPQLAFMSQIAWIAGFVIGLVVYYLLMSFSKNKRKFNAIAD